MNVAGMLRRLRVNLGLTIVIGMMVVVVTPIGLIGLAGFGFGVTDRKADPARYGQTLSV